MGDKRIDVQTIFEDRTYQLGETIDVAVQLNASKSINIRKIRLFLRCVEAYDKAYSSSAFVRIGNASTPDGSSIGTVGPTHPGEVAISAIKKGFHKHHEVIFKDTLVLSNGTSMKSGESKRLAGKFAIRPKLPPGDIFEDSLGFTFVLAVSYKGLIGSRTETEEKPVKIIPYLSRVKPRNT